MVSSPLKYYHWNIKIPSQTGMPFSSLFHSKCFSVSFLTHGFSGQRPFKTAAIYTSWMSAKVMLNNKTRDSRWVSLTWCGTGQKLAFLLLLITVTEVWRWQRIGGESLEDGVASLSGKEKEIRWRPVYSHINHCRSGKKKLLWFHGSALSPGVPVMQTLLEM